MQAAGAHPPESDAETAQGFAQAILALEGWQKVHGFVGAGEGGGGFAWAHCHPRLVQPLSEWVRSDPAGAARLQDRLPGLLADSGRFSLEEANALVGPFLQGEVDPVVPGSQPHNGFT